MKVKVAYSQKFFPWGSYEGVAPFVEVEDEVREEESFQEAYERINETVKYLFYQKLLDALGDLKGGEKAEELADMCVNGIENIDKDLLKKNVTRS